MSDTVVIMGAGGHAKVIADIIQKRGDKVYGFLDDKLEQNAVILNSPNFKVIGKIEKCKEIQKYNPNFKFIIAIGNNTIRKQFSEEYILNYYTAIHPTATIGIGVEIGKGSVIMAKACINPGAVIGKHTIVNTGAIIEHDNFIEDYCSIAPNATLGGTVKIGELSHIGIGSTVKNNVTICSKCIIGAGAVVVKNIEKEGTYIGIPAKIQKK